MKTRGIAAVVAVVASAFLCGTRADAQIATFENFSEGFLGGRFVDPASGIIFTNAVYNFPNGGFSIDYGALTNPPLPGNYLTGNAHSPGPGVGLTAGFGFTFILPSAATTVQMDQFYLAGPGESYSMDVTAYATNGQVLIQTNVPLPGAFPQISYKRTVVASAVPISYVTVRTPSNSAIGFDNIGAPIAPPPVIGPTLRMVRSEANATAVLFWPTNEAGFTLQSATNLSPPINWVSNLPAPSVFGTQYRVTVSFSGERRFFRLHKP